MVMFRVGIVSLAVFALLGCEPVDVSITARGVRPRDVVVEVKSLGRMSEDALAARAAKPDIDGVQRLPKGSCPDQPCAVAQVTVFIKNTTDQPLPPPVVRVEAPAGRPQRLPIALRAPEITPDYTGRIKWLVQLWPGEEALRTHLSSSVWLAVDKPAQSDQSAPDHAAAAKTPPAPPKESP